MKEKKPLPHPSFDELLALTVDDLGDQRAHEVREHLLDCPACLAQMRELLHLPDEAPSPQMELSDAELAADWQRLSATLDEEESTSKREPQAKPQLHVLPDLGQAVQPTKMVKPSRRSAMALMAALLAGTAIGLVFGYWNPHEKAASSVRPVALTNLISSATYHRGELEKPTKAKCPSPDGDFVWILVANSRPDDPKANLWAEIRSDSGRIIDRSVYELNAWSEIQFSIPRAVLPNGHYFVALRREEDGPITEGSQVLVDCP